MRHVWMPLHRPVELAPIYVHAMRNRRTVNYRAENRAMDLMIIIFGGKLLQTGKIEMRTNRGISL
jgi:hypothetical protein